MDPLAAEALSLEEAPALLAPGPSGEVAPPHAGAAQPGAAHTLPASAPAAKSDTLAAIRNAVKLSGSLAFTGVLALVVRLLLLPRYLGPDRFGELNFADAFATTLFVALNLGLDTYVRKEVSVRLEHANDFYGGTLAVRLLLTLALGGVALVVLDATGRSPEVKQLVLVYALGQVCVHLSNTLSAMLQAKGTVDGVSLVAVVSKVLWAGGILLAIALKLGMWAFPAAILASELLRLLVCWQLANKHLALQLRFDAKMTWMVLVACLPFYLNTFAHLTYARLDVSILAVMGTDREVGYYGAAGSIGALMLIITPLVGWVLMPVMARAAARSRDELLSMTGRSLEHMLVLAVPTSLAIALGADLIVKLLFGAAFAPVTPALRVLSLVFILGYVDMVVATLLMLLDRGWRVTGISVVALAVNPLLNFALIGPAMASGVAGAGGAACAFAQLGTEVFVLGAMLVSVQGRLFDRKSALVLVKTALTCAVTALVHFVLPARLGWGRLFLDGAVYVLAGYLSGALQPQELLQLARAAFQGRAARGAGGH